MGEIVGHKGIIDGITRRKSNDSFSHANLIVGENGIGKSIIAKYIANSIMGIDYNSERVDIVKYYPSSSSFGVDDVRKIIDEVNKKPYEGSRKVLILYKCEKLTVQGQNAFLKTIEEPPKGVYLILLSDSIETILDTIQSRCQVYKLTPLSKDEILTYIDNKYPNLLLDDKKAAVAYSGGIPGNIDRFIDDKGLKNLRNILILLFEDVLKRNQEFVMKYTNLLNDSKGKNTEVLNILISYIRDIMIFKELNNNTLVINLDKMDKIKDISRGISYKKLNNMLEYIREARLNFNSNANYSMTISVLLMGFVEV